MADEWECLQRQVDELEVCLPQPVALACMYRVPLRPPTNLTHHMQRQRHANLACMHAVQRAVTCHVAAFHVRVCVDTGALPCRAHVGGRAAEARTLASCHGKAACFPQALQSVFPERGAVEMAAAEEAALRFAQHLLEHVRLAGAGAADRGGSLASPHDVGSLSGTVWCAEPHAAEHAAEQAHAKARSARLRA